MKREKIKREVLLAAKLEVYDRAGMFESGDIEFPIDRGLLDALFDVTMSGELGDERIRMIYCGDCFDLYNHPKTVKLSEILEMRDRVRRSQGESEAREAIRAAIGA